MTFFKTSLQYLCVGVLFGLVGAVYALLKLSGLTGLALNIPTLMLLVFVFLLAKRLCPYIDGDRRDNVLQGLGYPLIELGTTLFRHDSRLGTTLFRYDSRQLGACYGYTGLSAFSAKAKLRFQIEQARIELDLNIQAQRNVQDKIHEIWRQHFPGSYSSKLALTVPASLDLDIVALAEKKTRDEMIKLQRKPLETAAASTPFSNILAELH